MQPFRDVQWVLVVIEREIERKTERLLLKLKTVYV